MRNDVHGAPVIVFKRDQVKQFFMNYKSTLWLLMFVCVLGLIIWIFENPFRPEPQTQPGLLGKKSEEINSIIIEKGDFRLQCERQDGNWRISSPVNARAESAAIDRFTSLLERLEQREASTLKQRKERKLSLADYGLNPPTAKIMLGNADNEKIIHIGSNAPLGESVYFRFPGSGTIMSTDSELTNVIPSTVEQWRNKQVLLGRPEDTIRLELRNKEGRFIQILKTDSEWKMTQPLVTRADAGLVDNMLHNLYSLQIAQFVRDADIDTEKSPAGEVRGTGDKQVMLYGLDSEEAQTEVSVWLDGKDTGQKLLLGKPVSEKGNLIYVRFRDSDSIYAVSSRILDYLNLGIGALRSKRLFTTERKAISYIDIHSGEKRLTLTKSEDGVWTIVAPLRWRADQQAVDNFVDGLFDLRIASFVPQTQTNLLELGFSPPAWTVQALESEPPSGDVGAIEHNGTGKTSGQQGKLIVGRATGDSKQRIALRFSNEPVKFGEEGFVYKVKKDALAFAGKTPANPLQYFDHTILALNPESIKKIETFVQGRKETLVRDDNNQWIVADDSDRMVNKDALDDFLFAAANLRAIRIEELATDNAASYGLRNSTMVFKFSLRGEEGIQKTLKLGYRARTDGIYAMVQGQNVVFVLSNAVVSDLIRALTTDSGPVRHPITRRLIDGNTIKSGATNPVSKKSNGQNNAVF